MGCVTRDVSDSVHCSRGMGSVLSLDLLDDNNLLRASARLAHTSAGWCWRTEHRVLGWGGGGGMSIVNLMPSCRRLECTLFNYWKNKLGSALWWRNYLIICLFTRILYVCHVISSVIS